jgi:hypothetical protein
MKEKQYSKLYLPYYLYYQKTIMFLKTEVEKKYYNVKSVDQMGEITGKNLEVR